MMMRHEEGKGRFWRTAAALIMLAAVMFISGCKQSHGGTTDVPKPQEQEQEKPAVTTPRYQVTVRYGIGGKLNATVDGNNIGAGASVEKDKTVSFEAVPMSGYAVDKWMLNGTEVNGTKTKYALKVTAESKVTVSFKEDGSTAITKYTVTIGTPTNGRIEVLPELPADSKVPSGTEALFTAIPESGYVVDKWTIVGGSFNAGTGTEGNRSAKAVITANTTVNVTFKSAQEKVKLTVQGDEHVNLPAEPISVKKGAKWVEVKSEVEGKISFKPDYKFDSWYLGEDASAPELKDEDIFTEDRTVYVKSRAKLPELPKPTNPGDPTVKITFKLLDPNAGEIQGNNPITVPKNTSWSVLSDYANKAFKAAYGYKLQDWKKNGISVDNTFSFGEDTDIFAETEDLRITVTVTGNNAHLTIAEPATITVVDGAKWKDVKEKVRGKVTVKNANYAIAAWKLNNASGTLLTDDYEFKRTEGTSRTVYVETGDRRITLTVKYGRGFDTTKNGGTIIVYDGDTWGSVKARAVEKVDIPQGIILQEWRRDNASGEIISDDYTFKVSDGNERTFFARIRADIKMTTTKLGNICLTYYAPVNGDVTEREYWLYYIPMPEYPTAYVMGQTEVPQALYELVIGENPSHFKGSSYPPAEGENPELRPVENVNWYDCIAFCNELTRCTEGLGESDCQYLFYDNVNRSYTVQDAKDKKRPYINWREFSGFKLPFSDRWEFAAKGGDWSQKYSGSSDEDYLKNLAWYNENSENKTHEVAKKEANRFNLCDMSGNVAEWCTIDGLAYDEQHIIHGGSYRDEEEYCQCTRKYEVSKQTRNSNIGFRLCKKAN